MAGAAAMIEAANSWGFTTRRSGRGNRLECRIFARRHDDDCGDHDPYGRLPAAAYWAADFSKGRLFLLLALIGSLVTGLSLLLDNVTTVVIFGPLIILMSSLRVTPIPFLLLQRCLIPVA